MTGSDRMENGERTARPHSEPSRVQTALPTLLLLLAAISQAQTYCHWTDGTCYALPSPLGCPASATTNTTPCPAVSPTPTPTATPTPSPTPAPMSYSVTSFVKAKDLGMTYFNWPSQMNGVVWGNTGQCCPGIGTGPGECVFSLERSSNTSRLWWCTYRDSSQLWESASVQVASGDVYAWVVAGVKTYRPANDALQSDFHEGTVWGFGVPSITQTWFGISTLADVLRYPDAVLFPLGILDLDGARWLYARVWSYSEADYMLGRWYWPRAWQSAQWSSETILSKSIPSFQAMAIDSDGSLIATTGELQNNLVVKIWRSKDKGRTWTDTGSAFSAPSGTTMFQCGFEHKSGGAAVVPWHLLCVQGDGQGPDAGTWSIADIRVNGAKVPANWTVAPVLWK
jgi:hypothetical protein